MADDRPKHALALGTAAPGFALPALDGRVVALGDYRGHQPLLLVFYRGWW